MSREDLAASGRVLYLIGSRSPRFRKMSQEISCPEIAQEDDMERGRDMSGNMSYVADICTTLVRA